MRLVIHNPQKLVLFGLTVRDWLTRGKVPAKYAFFLKYLRDKKAIIYCDGHGSSISFVNRYLERFNLSKPFQVLEMYLWMCINKINPFSVKIIFNSKSIKTDDLLFTFAHGNFDNESESSKQLIGLHCVKVIHVSHYMYSTSRIAKNIKNAGAHLLVAENNLKKNNLYFKKYFADYAKDVYVLPFCFNNKFRNLVPFPTRMNKCLATGSMQSISRYDDNLSDVCSFFETDTFHPMRRDIHRNKDKIAQYIDSFISDISEDLKGSLSNVKDPTGNFLQQIYTKIKNSYFIHFPGNYARRPYFDFDIVRKYNEYKMFVVPEEIVGLPGIGFVEGMACGCAYIGIRDDMYRDIGLIEGIHYIGYDNNLESLLTVIKYYQNHGEELEKIARAGCEYVRKHFSEAVVAETFYRDLEVFISKR